jgi:hypothetical protein
MDIQLAANIAKKKGFILSFCDSDESYVLQDKRDLMPIMTYSPITLGMMKEHAWREECNKLRVNSEK